MKTRPTPTSIRLLLFAGLLLHAPVAAGPLPLEARPQLTADVRDRLAGAAQDTALAPWQRAFMLEVARGSTGGHAGDASPAPRDASLRSIATAADDGAWIAIPPPSGRYGHAAVYDPVRDRMLVFGGTDGGGLSLRDEVWALPLAGSPAWTLLSPAGTPPSARYGHTAIYDPIRDRMLVFGGADDIGYRDDVWALSLGEGMAWSELAPKGNPPSARRGHTAIYDPVRDRMLVFGGTSYGELNDVWALSLAGSPAWSELAPAGGLPVEREGHTAIYDPVRDRMLVFGGVDASSNDLNDVWALSLAGSPAWSEFAPTGFLPSERDGHTAIYDPGHDRMVVFGGIARAFGFPDDVWALSLSGSPGWSDISPVLNLPPGRYAPAAIYDPVRDRMLIMGGFDGSRFYDDLLDLSLAAFPTWGALVPGGGPPVERGLHTAIHDPLRARMIVFGGFDGTTYRNDVWALPLAESADWSVLVPTGSPPTGRFGHTAIYDAKRDRMLVFGGSDGYPRNDLWELSLAGTPAWSELSPTGSPPPARDAHTAIYDPVRDRMLVFGGYGGGSYHNDVWALSLAGSTAWSELVPAGAPPPARYLHAAMYDPVRDRMLVFGGTGWGGSLNDLWELSLAGSPAWSELTPAGIPPSARDRPSAIYDAARDRMVVFGGISAGAATNDVWALSLGASPGWRALTPAGSPPAGRGWHAAINDPLGDRMVAFGGLGAGEYRDDTWALEWGALVSVPGDPGDLPNGFALAAPRPNPSPGPFTLDFTLPQAAHVSLAIHDVAGRMVRGLLDGPLPAGRHSIYWDGRDRSGQVVHPGVYLVRLAAHGWQAVRKAVLADVGSR